MAAAGCNHVGIESGNQNPGGAEAVTSLHALGRDGVPAALNLRHQFGFAPPRRVREL